MKNESLLASLNEEIKKLGKNKEAELLYNGIRDKFSRWTLYVKCKNHSENIALVSTDLNSVIGCYCLDKWEDTTDKKDHKDIVSGRPFLFYSKDN